MNLKQRIENYKWSVDVLKACQSPFEHQEAYRVMVKNKAKLVEAILELDSNYDLEQLEKDAS